MKVSKIRLSPATVIALVALFVALGGVGVAATGDNFVLGKSNSAGAKTALTAGISDRALAITNMNVSSSATALGLNVPANRPPLIVNSSTKVANLNADRLDGKDSASFLPSGGDIALWYSPFEYQSDQAAISVTPLAGAQAQVRSATTGAREVFLPIDLPESIFGRTLKLKSATICFNSQGAPITSTGLFYGSASQAGTLYSDNYTHSSPVNTCYDVALPNPTAVPGSLYLELELYYAGSTDKIYLYPVKVIVGT
jgi:hypothetical protein